MLAQNLKWAFLTILTCIEKSEAYSQDKIDINVNRHGGNDETGENQNPDDPPIMSDLVCFKNILMSLQVDLHMLSSQDYKKNSQYYKSTLEKLINRLFIIEKEDGGDEEDADQNQKVNNNHHNIMTHKNQLLDKVKKELL